MVKKQAQFLVRIILLAALPAAGHAQDLNTVINNVTKAMGSANVKAIHYSGSGSSYTGGKNAVWVKSYVRDIDLGALSSRVQIIREQVAPESQNIGKDAPWSKQFELWTNPLMFLKGAAANNATVSALTGPGEKFTVVSFMIQDKYMVRGFIDDKNIIVRIQAAIDPNQTIVDTIFRDYQDFNGLRFPTMIIEKVADELSMILVVSDVKAN